MKNFTISFIFLNLFRIGFSQVNCYEILRYKNHDTIFEDRVFQNSIEQLSLDNLLNKHDSINFRIWNGYIVLDFKLAYNNQLTCRVVNFNWIYNDPFPGNPKLFFEEKTIDNIKAHLLWHRLTDLGFLNSSRCTSNHGWISRGSFPYTIEFSNDSIYKNLLYWIPVKKKDIMPDLKLVNNFFMFADSTLNLYKGHATFTNNLPKNNRYEINIVTVKGTKENN